MSKKQEFISYVEALITGQEEPLEMSDNVRLYWEALKGKEEEEKPLFTDNGKLILQYMKNNQEPAMLKARDIADGMVISSRQVSGAIRKLVTDGFVDKMGSSPVIYSLTTKGKDFDIKSYKNSLNEN